MRNKKIAAILTFGLVLTTCSTPAVGDMKSITSIANNKEYSSKAISIIKEAKAKQTLLEKQAAEVARLNKNTESIKKALIKLESTVGKTWYVFSGSTPSGWDCSGLTKWFYEQVGVSLVHRASIQGISGEKTTSPKVGDIVVFTYNGYKSAYHVGIYIGENKMIHSPRKGEVTRIEDISSFGGSYSKVTYRTFIDTNQIYASSH